MDFREIFGKKVRVEEDEIKPFCSPFLTDGGLGKNRFRIAVMEIDGKTVKARFHMTDYYISPIERRFHLDAANAMAIVTQVGIAQVLYLNGYVKKSVEVYMGEYNVHMARQVTSIEDNSVHMTVLSHVLVPAGGRRKTDRTFYKFKFDLCEGAMIGTILLAFPFSLGQGFREREGDDGPPPAP